MQLHTTRRLLWFVAALAGSLFLVFGGPRQISAVIRQERVQKIVDHYGRQLDALTQSPPTERWAAANNFAAVVNMRDLTSREPVHDPGIDGVVRRANEALVNVHTSWITATRSLSPTERLEALRDAWQQVEAASIPIDLREKMIASQRAAACGAWSPLLANTLAATGRYQDVHNQLERVVVECGPDFARKEGLRLNTEAASLWADKFDATSDSRGKLAVVRAARDDLQDPKWLRQQSQALMRALTDEVLASARAAVSEGRFVDGLEALDRARNDIDLVAIDIEVVRDRLAAEVRSRLIARFDANRAAGSERDAMRSLVQAAQPLTRWVDVSSTVTESKERVANLLRQALLKPTVIDSPMHAGLANTLPAHERTQQMLDLALMGVLAQGQPAQRAAEFDLALAPILRQPFLREITMSPYARGRLARLTAPDDPSPEYVAVVPLAASIDRAMSGFAVDAKAVYDLVDDRLLDIRFHEDTGRLHIVRVELDEASAAPIVQYEGSLAVKELFTPGQHGFKTATLTDLATTKEFAESVDRVLSFSIVSEGGEFVARTPTVTGRDLGGPKAGRLTIEDLAVLHRAYAKSDNVGFSLDPCYDAEVFARVLSAAMARLGNDLPTQLLERLNAIQAKAKEVDRIPGNDDDPTGWHTFLSEGGRLREWVARLNNARGFVARREVLRSRPSGLTDDFRRRVDTWADGFQSQNAGVITSLRTELAARDKLEQAFNQAADSFWIQLAGKPLVPSQTFRYDAAETAGTEVGWTLAYTDVIMKLWSIRATGTEVPVPGLVSLLDLPVDPSLTQFLKKLSGARMWLELDPACVLRDDASVRFAGVATRISARGRDGSPIPTEKPPAPQFEETVRGWNSAYAALADFEPQYARLDQIMRWSVVFSYVAAANDNRGVGGFQQRQRGRARMPWLAEIESTRIPDPAQWWAAHPELREQTSMRWETENIRGTKHPILPRLQSPSVYVPGYGPAAAYSGGVTLPSRKTVESRSTVREALEDSANSATACLAPEDRIRDLSPDDVEQLLSRFSDQSFQFRKNKAEREEFAKRLEALREQGSEARRRLSDDPELKVKENENFWKKFEHDWRDFLGPLERYVIRSNRDGFIALWSKRGDIYSASSRLRLATKEGTPVARAVAIQVGDARRPLRLNEELRYERVDYPLTFGDNISKITLSTLEVGVVNDGRIPINYVPRDRILSAALTDALASGADLPRDVFSDIRVSEGGRRFEAAVKPEHGGGIVVAAQGGGRGRKPPSPDISAGGQADPNGWEAWFVPDGVPQGDPAPSGPQFSRVRMTGKPGSTLRQGSNGTRLSDGELHATTDTVWSPPQSAIPVDLWVLGTDGYEYCKAWSDESTRALFVPTEKASLLAGLEGRITDASDVAWKTRSKTGMLLENSAQVVTIVDLADESHLATFRRLQIPSGLRHKVRIGTTISDDPTVEIRDGIVRIGGVPKDSAGIELLSELVRRVHTREIAKQNLVPFQTTLSRAKKTFDLAYARSIATEIVSGQIKLRDDNGVAITLEAAWKRSASEPLRLELSANVRTGASPEALHGFFREMVNLRVRYPDIKPQLYIDLGLPGITERLAACANLHGVEMQVHHQDLKGVRGAERAMTMLSGAKGPTTAASSRDARHRSRVIHNRGPETIRELEAELLDAPASADCLDVTICIDAFKPEQFQQIFELCVKLIASNKYSSVTINVAFVSLPGVALVAKEVARRGETIIPAADQVMTDLCEAVLARLNKFKVSRDESLLDADELGLLRDLGRGEITDDAIDEAIEGVQQKRDGISPPISVRHWLDEVQVRRTA